MSKEMLLVSTIQLFSPRSLGNDPIWRLHIFQMGWFNHQLEHHLQVFCCCPSSSSTFHWSFGKGDSFEMNSMGVHWLEVLGSSGLVEKSVDNWFYAIGRGDISLYQLYSYLLSIDQLPVTCQNTLNAENTPFVNPAMPTGTQIYNKKWWEAECPFSTVF